MDMRLIKAALIVLVAAYAACVGEDSSGPPAVVVVGEDAGSAASPSQTTDAAPPIDGTVDAGSSCWDKPFQAPVLVSALNTPGVELNIRLSADERTAYLTSNRDGGVGGGDLWVSTRAAPTDDWGGPTNMGALNTPSDEVHPAVSPDNLSLFFVRSVFPDAGNAHTNIYVVTRPSAFPTPPFTDYAPVEVPNINTSSSESFPYVAANELYFASDRNGDMKIFHSKKSGASFDAPAEIPGLHEPGSIDNLPLVSADGLRLFFASNRNGTKGALDIYMATRPTMAATFGAPSSVTELNTASNDRPGFISADGCRMYLTSDRPGGPGGLDIWLATRQP